MSTVQQLTQDVAIARASFLDAISNVSEVKAGWKPAPDVWSIIEITEHLFWAEQGGIVGMWKTLHAIRTGTVERNYESDHKNMPIEQVIDLTWQPKEKVPAVAAPTNGWAFILLEIFPTQPARSAECIWSRLTGR